MIWLVLSILSSTAVAVLLKYASVRRVAQFPLFAVNYATALVFGLVLAEQGSAAAEPAAGIALAVATGVLYVLGFLVFKRTITEAGTGIATSVSRLSVTLPVLISVAAFGEIVGGWQAAGIVLAIAVLPLSGKVWPPRRDELRAGALVWTLAVFVIFGLNDIVLKVRSELLPGSDPGFFFALLFGTAGVISVALALARRQRFRALTLLGIPLGAVNYGTAHFLANALETVPGSQAFTLNSVGVMLVAVVAGRLLFAERLARHNYLFLAGSVAAIVLVRLPA
ncbi:MAG: hypothetical protein ACOC7V_01980 [Spirochaetota bacterium]